MKVRFICLANSRKHGGRCVAGIRTDGSGWIRPVSPKLDGSLTPRDYALNTGREAGLLDVIEATVSTARPEPHQPENWTINNTKWGFIRTKWRFIETLNPSQASRELSAFLVSGPQLLGNLDDRVSYEFLKSNPASTSLALIEPSTISWLITDSFRGSRQTRARFQLGGQNYNLVITDPTWRARLSMLDQGVHPREAAGINRQDRVLFTISLAEPFDQNVPSGDCFKLVAGVMVLPS